tara:strand:+ start:1563 stop:2045 length:483 start_codon:yes stop_codon:yes gene_type:complete
MLKPKKAKLLDLVNQDKHLVKKGHDSYEVDGKTTFVKPKRNKVRKRLFGGTVETYKAKGDENSPIKSIKEKTVKDKYGMVKKNKKKVEYKKFLDQQHEDKVKPKDKKLFKKKKKDIKKANRMQSRAMRVLDRPRLSDKRRDKMHDLLKEENKLREKYEKK